MRYIEFHGDKISKLSMGTVQFGLNYGVANSIGKPTQKSVNDIVEYVYNNGVNCLDTAQAYGDSEKVLGEAITNKENLFIISKLKSNLFEENLQINIDISLKNLKIKKLYALLLHDSELLYRWKDNHTSLVQNLISRNKIDYFGVSIYSDEDFNLALNNENIKIIQIPFNLFDQRAVHNNWLKLAKEKNKLIFIRSIFLQGLFFMDLDALEGNLIDARKYLEKLHQLKNSLNLSTVELAMSYVDSVADSSILLFGCDTLAQAKENIELYNRLPKLDKETIATIEYEFQDIEESITNPTLWKLK